MSHLVATSGGKTLPQDVWNALNLLEKTGNSESMWSNQPFLKSHLKELTARCEESSPMTKQALPPTIAIIVSLELYVTSDRPQFKRAMAWVRLLKLWACLRADDVQGIVPDNVVLNDTGLTLTLRRTKTSGPGKKHVVVRAHVARDISLTGRDWLAIGFELWQEWSSARDFFYLLPQKDYRTTSGKMAGKSRKFQQTRAQRAEASTSSLRFKRVVGGRSSSA
eukprot:6471669-Amphidinium_carterae.1